MPVPNYSSGAKLDIIGHVKQYDHVLNSGYYHELGVHYTLVMPVRHYSDALLLSSADGVTYGHLTDYYVFTCETTK